MQIKVKHQFLIDILPTAFAFFLTIFILLSFNILPQKLPLFYSLQWGESQLVDKHQLLIIPAIIIGIALLNLMIAWQLHQDQFFLKRSLLALSLLSCAILTIAFIKILFIFF